MIPRVRFSVFMAIIMLFGCAGYKYDFTESDLKTMTNGRTTFSEVTAAMGKPHREGSLIKNEKTLRTASYSNISLEAQPVYPGIRVERAVNFYFYNGILVGHTFSSSWAEDHTDFDDSIGATISKGETTREEVFQLLGKPRGYILYPLIKSPTGEAADYLFSWTREHLFGKPESFTKELVVTFDAAGLVVEVEFESRSRR